MGYRSGRWTRWIIAFASLCALSAAPRGVDVIVEVPADEAPPSVPSPPLEPGDPEPPNAAPPRAQLPRTGAAIDRWLVIALGAITAGTVAVDRARRTSHTTRRI